MRARKRSKYKPGSILSGTVTLTKNLPKTYKLEQPPTNAQPKQTATDPAYRVRHSREIDPITAKVRYYEVPDSPAINIQDALYFERTTNTTPADTVTDSPAHTGEVITTEITVGDVFYASSWTGLWEYVGVAHYDNGTKYDDGISELLVFEPANNQAEESITHRNSRYKVWFTGDFAHKFSTYTVSPEYSDRGRIIHRVNPDAYSTDIQNLEINGPDDLRCNTVETIKQHSSTVQNYRRKQRQSVISGYIDATINGKWDVPREEIPENVEREHQYTDGAFTHPINERII